MLNATLDDFKRDASFDVGLSQMNDSDFQIFTQADDKKLSSHSTPRATVGATSKPDDATSKSDGAVAKRDDLASYRDVIESDDSFEYGLSQIPDFEFDANSQRDAGSERDADTQPDASSGRDADTQPDADDCTPNKQKKLMMTPVLSKKLKSKLQLDSSFNW